MLQPKLNVREEVENRLERRERCSVQENREGLCAEWRGCIWGLQKLFPLAYPISLKYRVGEGERGLNGMGESVNNSSKLLLEAKGMDGVD